MSRDNYKLAPNIRDLQKELLEEVRGWTNTDECPPHFDDTFLTSLEDWFDDHDELTNSQYDSLLRIKEKWRINE